MDKVKTQTGIKKEKVIEFNELNLLKGSPIYVENAGYVYPITIGDMEMIGEEKCEKWLRTLAIEESVLADLLKLDECSFSTFDFIVASVLNDEEVKNDVIEGISFFFKEDVLFIEDGFFIIGDMKNRKYLNKDNYPVFKKLIRVMNCIDSKDTITENPSNAKAAQILKKRKEAREKLKKAKSNGDSDSFTWAELVSILCANGNGVTLENVWGMSVYAFNNQFSRMQMIESYDIGIRSLLAGAKKEDVDLKHWMSKL